MPTPIAPPIILSHKLDELQAIVRAHSTPQSLALHARIVLRAAEVMRPTNLHLGQELGCSISRSANGASAIEPLDLAPCDAPRSGRLRTLPRRRVSRSLRWPVHCLRTDRTVIQWTLDEIVAMCLDALHTDAISRSSILAYSP